MEEVERFKTIEYNSYVAERYEVSTLGRVRNKQTGRIFTAFPRKKGDYAAVVLQIGAGQQKTFSVHLLVAKAFCLIRIIFQKLTIKTKIKWTRDSAIWNGVIGSII